MEDAKKQARNITRQTNKITAETKSRMQELGTYMTAFDTSIERYAELRVQYNLLKAKWLEDGCVITEEYTNKAGATNNRKTPVYMAMETLRKDILDMENLFGLTPKGLKQLRAKGLEGKKTSALGEALKDLTNGL